MMPGHILWRKSDGFIDLWSSGDPDANVASRREGEWGYTLTDQIDVDRFSAPDGVITPKPISQAELAAAVDFERDRRISLGVTWRGTLFQTRRGTDDLFNITSMGALAAVRVAGNTGLRWLNPSADFYWIAADNSHVTMTAADMLDFSAAAALWVSSNILAGAAIKATAGGIPESFSTDPRWPA